MLSYHTRILLLIGGLAVAASLTIGAAFVATEAERSRIQAREVASGVLQGHGDDLAAAIRDQQSAIDDYLLAGDPAALARFGDAQAAETELADLIRAETLDPSPIRDALTTVTAATADWRANFAEAVIAIGATGSAEAKTALAKSSTRDQSAAHIATGDLIEQLDAVDADLRAESDNLNHARTLATGLGVGFELVAAAVSLWFVRRYGLRLERDAVRSSVLNRFTEVTTFASDDEAVARLNLEAIRLLVRPDAAMTHVLNRSKDRAVPEASLGGAVAEILPLRALSDCPGVIRGSVYVTDDAAEPLSVHCPIYPTDHGTVACVPLSHGENVGAVHLFWEHPRAFPLELRSSVARIAEHAALAIGNRRLLAALHGQANADPRTGLSNSRAFDRALEEALSEGGTKTSTAVLMLDLDHFKDVNDRHGHPAGDEALRAFAGVLRSCMRDGDLAARYGGEEFAVLLTGVDEVAALAIAERIRSRTESTLISLAPGVTERLTVSIGVSLAADQGLDRIPLLRLADAALYEAKQAGRNRVRYAGNQVTLAVAAPVLSALDDGDEPGTAVVSGR